MPNNENWLSDEEYKLITSMLPIICVDLVILRQVNNGTEVLLLTRKTGYEAGKKCIIGGRIRIGETTKEAIERHASDLGVKVEIIPPFDDGLPAWVNSHPDQDKTKQPIPLIYPVTISKGEIKPEGQEYSGFEWVSVDNLPEKMAYDHLFEIKKALEQLNKFKAMI